jgi:hypothetical protein
MLRNTRRACLEARAVPMAAVLWGRCHEERDARCGRFHPANSFLVHELVAKTALGIDLGEQRRWG